MLFENVNTDKPAGIDYVDATGTLRTYETHPERRICEKRDVRWWNLHRVPEGVSELWDSKLCDHWARP